MERRKPRMYNSVPKSWKYLRRWILVEDTMLMKLKVPAIYSWFCLTFLVDEQRERAMRARLNNEFQNFVRKVEEVVPGGLEFDIPYRDLGFEGVPHRSSVLLQPTVHCLVHLTEQPFFVLSLDQIEIAYFERVQVSLPCGFPVKL